MDEPVHGNKEVGSDMTIVPPVQEHQQSCRVMANSCKLALLNAASH